MRGERSERPVRCCGQRDRRLPWFWSGRGAAQSHVPGPGGVTGRELPGSGGWAALVADIFLWHVSKNQRCNSSDCTRRWKHSLIRCVYALGVLGAVAFEFM